MPLGLHRRAHHPEDGPESSVPGSEARDDGVHRTLPRSDGVRVAWFQAEQVAAVVEADTRTLGDDTAAEAFIEAVYERTAVAFRIHRAEVGRVPAGCGLGHALRGVFPRDAPTQVRGVVFRDQTSRQGLLSLCGDPRRRASSPRPRGGYGPRSRVPWRPARILRGC